MFFNNPSMWLHLKLCWSTVRHFREGGNFPLEKVGTVSVGRGHLIAVVILARDRLIVLSLIWDLKIGGILSAPSSTFLAQGFKMLLSSTQLQMCPTQSQIVDTHLEKPHIRSDSRAGLSTLLVTVAPLGPRNIPQTIRNNWTHTDTYTILSTILPDSL